MDSKKWLPRILFLQILTHSDFFSSWERSWIAERSLLRLNTRSGPRKNWIFFFRTGLVWSIFNFFHITWFWAIFGVILEDKTSQNERVSCVHFPFLFLCISLSPKSENFYFNDFFPTSGPPRSNFDGASAFLSVGPATAHTSLSAVCVQDIIIRKQSATAKTTKTSNLMNV